MRKNYNKRFAGELVILLSGSENGVIQQKTGPGIKPGPVPEICESNRYSFFLADFFTSVVFTEVLVTVSAFFLEVSALMVSFLEVSGFTVESTLVTELESTFDESELLLELVPLHAASEKVSAKASMDIDVLVFIRLIFSVL